MTQSPTQSSPNTNNDQTTTPHIPTEIVSEEEMALIEAALASALSSSSSSLFSPLSSTLFMRNARSISSLTLLTKKRRLSDCAETSSVGDIEDLGNCTESTQKTNEVSESFFHRFRRKRGLFVTDITATEWCEKQMEFTLLLGKPKTTSAMKAGSARHAMLEEEVIKRVTIRGESEEDAWAIKFINFILGANQLLFDGLTQTERNVTLVDTKTRVRATIPAEPQRRNGRLQLMCYKYLWDNLAADNFPSRQFFDFFSLDPHSILCEEIRETTANSGFPSETLYDLLRYFRNTCSMLSPAHDQLLLRYELQKDHSLLAEDKFTYDPEWLKGQIQCCVEFWLGKREANCTPMEERWKCRFCKFASTCPANTNSEGTQS
ncbi:exonuclease V, chloroplastic-like isoform X2 [Cornus florida]|uniref:exonuclease V, chloroplastic-like isoform X2 n=1 Tax=Cornus florida TaxID=4283 RepID=UPI00289920C7|nr:exonuclease V, chloroplastic-like isoform X2 [Cornus florida]